MKHLAISLLLAAAVAACAPAPVRTAQPADGAVAALREVAASKPADEFGPWLKTERERITASRAAAQQRFQDSETACWRRFAVNDCVRAARVERRQVTDQLRLEELALNEAERKRNTDARLRQLQEKQQGSKE